jgi:Tol biopolymer transport system component
MEVDFEHRSPGPDDTVKIGMVDLNNGDRWIELDQTNAWCWQQGCMLQWRPGSETEILWNDRQGARFVCHILDVKSRRKRTIPSAIYSVSPDGRTAVTADFRRIQYMRPGYGYAGLGDPFRRERAPQGSGIWRVDLETGRTELIVSIAEAARIPFPHGDLSDATHYFNHLLFNTDGSRFIFLHRWRGEKGRSGFRTRMLTASPEGKDIAVVDDNGMTSHFIWRDPQHILAYSDQDPHGRGFYLFEDRTRKYELIGGEVMKRDGHCSYLPGNEWILNDSYPDRQRNQTPYLYHIKSGRKVELGHFHQPLEYKGEWRVDTHPRFSPDGRSVVIDSPHGGNGRQMYLIDISRIVT